MPFGIGAPELIIVLVVFILFFGAKKLPDLSSAMGKSVTNFKKGLKDAKDEDEDQTVVTVEETPTTTTRTETKVPPTAPPTV